VGDKDGTPVSRAFLFGGRLRTIKFTVVQWKSMLLVINQQFQLGGGKFGVRRIRPRLTFPGFLAQDGAYRQAETLIRGVGHRCVWESSMKVTTPRGKGSSRKQQKGSAQAG